MDVIGDASERVCIVRKTGHFLAGMAFRTLIRACLNVEQAHPST